MEVAPEVIQAQRDLLAQMQRLATGARCRHEALSEYFGQAYRAALGAEPDEGCGACDVCLRELEEVPDSTTLARKILSCVARLRGERNEAFGAAYVAEVLRGAATAKVLQRGHEKLSTHGILKELEKETLVGFMNQLVDLGALAREVLQATGFHGDLVSHGRPYKTDYPVRSGTGNGSLSWREPSQAELMQTERSRFERSQADFAAARAGAAARKVALTGSRPRDYFGGDA